MAERSTNTTQHACMCHDSNQKTQVAATTGPLTPEKEVTDETEKDETEKEVTNDMCGTKYKLRQGERRKRQQRTFQALRPGRRLSAGKLPDTSTSRMAPPVASNTAATTASFSTGLKLHVEYTSLPPT